MCPLSTALTILFHVTHIRAIKIGKALLTPSMQSYFTQERAQSASHPLKQNRLINIIIPSDHVMEFLSPVIHGHA
jgi:hypothetical protein